MDVVEIDAASNRGIDEIRDIRDKVRYAPTEVRYKVYIIDEVHMLTSEAFNALLKTLEEPPPHIIFVLATTEPHKIPETILSRCQRFDFRRLTVDEIVSRLSDLARREGLAFEPQALTAIARHATGSLRDGESLLDQLIAYGDETITLAQVQAVLGTGSFRVVSDLVGHLAANDVAGGLDAINQAIDDGIAPGQLNRQVVEYLRGLMLIQVGDGDQLLNLPQETLEVMRDQAGRIPFRQVVQSLKLFNEAGRALKASLHPQLPLELAFVEAVTPAQTEPAAAPAQEAVASVAVGSSNPPAQQATPRPTAPTGPTPSPTTATPPDTTPVTSAKDGPALDSPAADGPTIGAVRSQWGQMLQLIRPRSALLQAVLRDGWAERVEGNKVVIGFDPSRQFHRDKASEAENRRIVEEALAQVLGQPCRVECEAVPRRSGQTTGRHSASPSPATPASPPAQAEPGSSPAMAREAAPDERYREATQDPVIKSAVEELGAQVVDVSDV